jgi:hypothetical protein
MKEILIKSYSKETAETEISFSLKKQKAITLTKEEIEIKAFRY